MQQAELLRSKLKALGFDAVHFTRLSEIEPKQLMDWLGQGFHADMQWIKTSADKRLDPKLVLPGVQSLILLGVNYYDGKKEEDSPRPKIARYARHTDYHDTIKPALASAGKILEELYSLNAEDYRYYVDTGPVLERAWAAQAGVGFVGKNAMLISREFGNWLLLSAILVRCELPADEPIRKKLKTEPKKSKSIGLLCGSCTRCMTACPTQAFTFEGTLDARRCISYQTIENKGIIPKALREGIGNRIFGCDTCLDVCPWNRFAKSGRKLLLNVREEGAHLSLVELLQMTEERFKELYRKTPLQRLKYPRFIRNVLIAAANAKDETLFELVLPYLSHPNNLIRAHAVDALRRIDAVRSKKHLQMLTLTENDPLVLTELNET